MQDVPSTALIGQSSVDVPCCSAKEAFVACIWGLLTIAAPMASMILPRDARFVKVCHIDSLADTKLF